MKKFQKSFLKRQVGLTMIELMIGILLSGMSVLAVLYAYKALVYNAMISSTNSNAQGTKASVALQVARILPSAGWGIGAGNTTPGGAANTDMVLLTGASLVGSTLSGTTTAISASSSSGNAIIWDSQINGLMQCSALVAASDGSLLLLGAVSCVDATSWSSLNWSSKTFIAGPGTSQNATINAIKTTCSPYSSVVGGQNAVKITFIGFGSSALKLCVINIPN